MLKVLRRWLRTFSRACRGWQQHDVPFLAAAIAFYTMLSLSPLVVTAVAVVAVVVPVQTASRYLLEVSAQVVNQETANFIQEVLRNTQRTSNALSAAGVSLVLALFGSARLFRQVKVAINIVWEARADKHGLWHTLLGHLMAVLMVLFTAVALLAWLGLEVALTAISSRITVAVPLWRWVSFVAGWALLTLLFAVAYRLLPDAPVQWRQVWAGASVGALLFALCKLLVGVFLGFSGIHSAYGAASAAVVLLLWAHFSAQAFIFGAEIARACGEEECG